MLTCDVGWSSQGQQRAMGCHLSASRFGHHHPASLQSPYLCLNLGDLFSFLVLRLKVVLVSSPAVYPALPAPGLSIAIWHVPAIPSPATPGHVSEAQTVQ